MTKRGAVYARISRLDKRVPKTDIQVSICRSLAEDHGVTVADEHVFIDDGIAASGKAIDDTTLENRPAARRLIAALEAGQIDVLFAVEGERLARTYLDGLRFIQASTQGGVTWVLDTDGALDPASPAGEETAVSIFAQGRREGRVRLARQKRRYDRERAEGRPLWGPRPFGYDTDRVTLRESEASLIREAVEQYLAGEVSLMQVAKRWTTAGAITDTMGRERRGRDGVVRMTGTTWTATTVRQTLLRPRNAGLLMHNGAELPNSQIQPIITREQHAALLARVKVGTPVGARAQSLLGGILRCECGAPMHHTVSYSQRKGGPRRVYQNYKCSQTLYDKSRKHASIGVKIADEAAIVRTLLRIANGDVPKVAEDSTVADQLANLSSRQVATTARRDRAAEILLDPDLESLHKQARGQLKAADAELEALKGEGAALAAHRAENGSLAEFVALWEELPIEVRESGGEGGWDVLVLATGRMLWDDFTRAQQQDIVRGLWAPSVRVGGRGAERVTFERP